MLRAVVWLIIVIVLISAPPVEAHDFTYDSLGTGYRFRISGKLYECDGVTPVANEYVGIYFNPGGWVMRDEGMTDEDGVWRVAAWRDFYSFAVVPGKDGDPHPDELAYYTRVEAPQFVGTNWSSRFCNSISCGFNQVRLAQGLHENLPDRSHYEVNSLSTEQFDAFFVNDDPEHFASGFDFVKVAEADGTWCEGGPNACELDPTLPGCPNTTPSPTPTPTPTPTPSPTPSPRPGDINLDGAVDGVDYGIFFMEWDKPVPPGDPRCDFNQDDVVDSLDYLTLYQNWDPL